MFESNGRYALLLLNPRPEPEAPDLLYLRYALVTLGPEEHIFPAFLLDDWGAEVKGLKLYQWVREHGNAFPRAEIFGFEQNGEETQCFLRELELFAKLPCYAFAAADTPIPRGVLLGAILRPDETVDAPQKIERPSDLERPLRAARVSWWLVPPQITRFDFPQSSLP